MQEEPTTIPDSDQEQCTGVTDSGQEEFKQNGNKNGGTTQNMVKKSTAHKEKVKKRRKSHN